MVRFKEAFGLGDILVLFCLSWLLSNIFFVILIFSASVGGMIFAILVQQDVRIVKRRIPFVSFLGLFYLLFFALAAAGWIPSVYSSLY